MAFADPVRVAIAGTGNIARIHARLLTTAEGAVASKVFGKAGLLAFLVGALLVGVLHETLDAPVAQVVAGLGLQFCGHQKPKSGPCACADQAEALPVWWARSMAAAPDAGERHRLSAGAVDRPGRQGTPGHE